MAPSNTFLALAALVAVVGGCSDAAGPRGPAKVPPSAVTVAVTGYVERGATASLAASRGSTLLPTDSVQWSATPATVAKVDTGQQLQFLDTGTVTVSAKVGDTTATKVIHVAAPPTIVFDMIDVGNSGTRTIFRAALDGVGLTRLASDSSENDKPTSANGLVVYESFRTGGLSLLSVPLAGGAESSLDSLPYPSLEPALSSDGTRLAFASAPTYNNKIWTSTAAGLKAAAATTGLGPDDVDEENPTWSPADTALVFVTTQYGDAGLVELSLGTSKETPLSNGTTTDVDPAWSPDGATLAFTSTRDGDVGIFVRSFQTGTITRLTAKPGNDGQPAWLADGRLIYTSWANENAPVLVWIDPAHPSALHQIPLPTGASPAHPAAAH